jgi:hypothetical protein
LHVVSTDVGDANSSPRKTAAILCPSGETVVTGGARVIIGTDDSVTPNPGAVAAITSSVPLLSSNGSGWSASAAAVSVINNAAKPPTTYGQGDATWTLQVFAVCGKIS